jgi:hypothetical protein
VATQPVSVSQNTITIGGNYAGEVSTTYDVTLHNSGATFASLSALLSDANLSTLIPTNVRKGGMSIKFVQTSDNKYVQCKLMTQTFSTTPSDWIVEITSIENNDGKFIVADENNHAAMIVDEDGVSSSGFTIKDNENNKKISFLQNNGALEIKDSNNSLVAGVDSNTMKVPSISLNKNNNEEGSINGEDSDFKVLDNNGKAGFIVDKDGIRTKAVHIVDDFNGDIKVIGENTFLRLDNIEHRLLIIGDSYSQQGLWVSALNKIIPFKSIVNLGVGSASVKDKYQDRETYPYTSRPVSNVTSGNLNTFACQIEKLKRLMAGVDLDEGETQIYTQQSEYPNIIIIEGGQNDGSDSDSVENTYIDQFVQMATNVYIQTRPNEEVTQGSCLIQAPIEDINRTCFGGAYRYLIEELSSLFPAAQIFITTRSNMSYWNNNWLTSAHKIVEQQRKCADLAGVSLIDWFRDGQISSINNHITGSGTQNDPYIWAYANMPDTNDLLHPNARGGAKLGQVAANAIISKIINI